MVDEQSRSDGGLDVAEDRSWQERFWTVQRVGWVLMAMFIIAAVAGITGKGGPVASATARTPAGEIDYPRIARWQTDELLVVRLGPAMSGKVDVAVSREFTELFTVGSIVPQPTSSVATGDGQRFTFDVGGGKGSKAIALQITPANPVLFQPMSVTIANSKPARIGVTVLP